MLERSLILNEMKSLFKRGQRVRLIKDRDNCGVEGFNVGEIYKIDDYRLRDDTIQYFFEDNVHAYYADCFESI
jgi:hypothetical protein